MSFDKAVRQSQSQAFNIVDQLRNIYTDAKGAQASLQLYQAGTDTVFNGTVNGLYTGDELTVIGEMLGHISTLLSIWEASPNYRTALSLPPQV